MVYEYECQCCGLTFEVEQSIKDSPLVRCSTCGKESLKRIISGGTGFLLKGSGWFRDGYNSSKKSTSSNSEE